MAWLLADAAEVFQGLDNSRSEELLPIAVYRSPCSQRLLGREEPFCKRETISRCGGGEFWKQSRYVRSQRRAYFREEISTFEFQRGSLLIGRLFAHHRKRNSGNLRQLVSEFLKLGKISGKFRIAGQRLPAPIAAGRQTQAPHQRRLVINCLGLRKAELDAAAGRQLYRGRRNTYSPMCSQEIWICGKTM